jgi:serine phosphatase RsbU (regulator of sigma subunit)
VELLEADQTVLGIDLPGRRPFQETQPRRLILEEGDMFIGYTDGLIEQPGAEGNILGLEPVTARIKGLTEATPKKALQALRDLLESYRGSQPLEDDLTLLLWQIR